MNPHILFVKDHLANPDKYTLEEIEANAKAALIYKDGADYAAAAALEIADKETKVFW